MADTKITPEISKYFSELGKKGGEKNKLRGREYFVRISKMRKTFGRQKKKTPGSPATGRAVR